MIKKFVATILLISTFAMLSACSVTGDVGEESNKTVLNDSPSSEKVDIYEKIIESVQVDWLGYGGYNHYYYPIESAQIYQIGIEGLPAIISKLSSITDESRKREPFDENKMSADEWMEKTKKAIEVVRYEEFWFYCTLTLLRTDGSDINSVLGGHAFELLNLLLYESTRDCKKIIDANWPVEDKLIELSRFGLLAIPYVLEEIEIGNSEYEEYFVILGLHLTTNDFAEYVYDWDIADRLSRYDNMRNDDRVKDFDYRAWLAENKQSLEALYKFADRCLEQYSPPANIRYSGVFIDNEDYASENS